jgi:hypothetical protein
MLRAAALEAHGPCRAQCGWVAKLWLRIRDALETLVEDKRDEMSLRHVIRAVLITSVIVSSILSEVDHWAWKQRSAAEEACITLERERKDALRDARRDIIFLDYAARSQFRHDGDTNSAAIVLGLNSLRNKLESMCEKDCPVKADFRCENLITMARTIFDVLGILALICYLGIDLGGEIVRGYQGKGCCRPPK